MALAETLPIEFLVSASVSHKNDKYKDLVGLLGEGPRQLIANYEINNRIYKVIVDTGATISILPQKGTILASIPQSDIKQTNLKVILADEGTKHIDKKIMILVRPQDSSRGKQYSCFYINDNTDKILGYDALIGLNIIRAFDIDIKVRQGLTQIYHDENLIGWEVVSSDTYQGYVQVDHSDQIKYINNSIKDDLSHIVSKYRSVFSELTADPIIGKPMRIYTFHMRPVAAKVRHYSPEEHLQMKDHIKELLEKGIIEPTESSYAAQSRIIPKKNGSGRLVINYIPLNRITLRDSYTSPHISDIIAILQGKRYFTTMDCTQGFYQILIDPNDRHKTAFSTSVGNYQFIRCPFGARNSGAYFQAEMNRIFFDGLYKRCVIYVDDILVFGQTIDEHNANLEWVLDRCRQYNVKIKYDKCHFAQTEVQYVGFLVSGDYIKPIKEKVDSMVIAKPPTNRTELKSILGKLNFYSRFINNYSKHMEPLRELLCANRDFQWKTYHQQSYDTLLESLKNAQFHHLVDGLQEKIIKLDALGKSLEAILTTTDGRLIHRTGRLLTSTEANYSLIEKHLLVLNLAMHKFRIWLHPDHFKIVTPIKGLDKLFTLINRPERVDQLILKLPIGFDKYTFEVEGSINIETLKNKRILGHVPQEIYYIDGACKRNGKEDCRASWAVCAEFDNKLELTGFVKINASNQTAEIRAAIEACRYAKSIGQSEITIVTDSNHVHGAVTNWIEKWKQNNWLDTKRKSIINVEEFKELLEAKKGLQIEWLLVKGHQGHIGNERADTLAQSLLDTKSRELCASIKTQVLLQKDTETEQLKKRIREYELDNFIIRNELIYYIDPKLPDGYNERIFVPLSNRIHLLELAHDNQMYGGHLGVKKTHRKLSRYWWPGIYKTVENYVKSCHICQRLKSKSGLPHGFLHSIPVSQLFEHIHIDIVGPMTRSTFRGKTHVITATDAFSKNAFAQATGSPSTIDLIQFVESHILAVHGKPQVIISDRGTQFTSHEWRYFLKKNNIEHKMTTPYHPQANGMDERLNGTLMRILAKYVNFNGSDWDEQLKWALFNYNTTVHESSGHSPYQILYGVNPRSPLTSETGDDTSIDELANHRQIIRKEARSSNIRAQEKQQRDYDRYRSEVHFKIGDLVLCRNHTTPADANRKFYPKWSEPVMIVEFIGELNHPKAVKVLDLTKQQTKIIAVEHLKLYKIRDKHKPLDKMITDFRTKYKQKETELPYEYDDIIDIGSSDDDLMSFDQPTSNQQFLDQPTSNTECIPSNSDQSVNDHIRTNTSLSNQQEMTNRSSSSETLSFEGNSNPQPISSTPKKRRLTYNDQVETVIFTPNGEGDLITFDNLNTKSRDENPILSNYEYSDSTNHNTSKDSNQPASNRNIPNYRDDCIETNPSQDPTFEVNISRLPRHKLTTRSQQNKTFIELSKDGKTCRPQKGSYNPTSIYQNTELIDNTMTADTSKLTDKTHDNTTTSFTAEGEEEQDSDSQTNLTIIQR